MFGTVNTWGVSDKPGVCDGSLHNTNHQFQAKLLGFSQHWKVQTFMSKEWVIFKERFAVGAKEKNGNKSYPLQGISFVVVFLFVNEQSIKNQWHVSTQWCPGADPGFCERVVWVCGFVCSILKIIWHFSSEQEKGVRESGSVEPPGSAADISEHLMRPRYWVVDDYWCCMGIAVIDHPTSYLRLLMHLIYSHTDLHLVPRNCIYNLLYSEFLHLGQALVRSCE